MFIISQLAIVLYHIFVTKSHSLDFHGESLDWILNATGCSFYSGIFLNASTHSTSADVMSECPVSSLLA